MRIPVAQPSITAREIEACKDAVASGWVSQGKRVEEFEELIAVRHGKKYGIACNSGTSALHLALAALNIGPGDFVVCPTMTMVAVPNAARFVGAIPVFIDSESITGNMDQDKAVDALHRFHAKAVIAPHLYGVPACVEKLPPEILIEDCAESHYASHSNGRPVGSIGTLACFSFYANKIVCTGEGGIVLTDHDDVAHRLRALRSHAFSEHEHFHHQELAFGYRMTDLQAALGIAQHYRHAELLKRREDLARQYLQRLEAFDWISVQSHPRGSVWWVMPLLIEDDAPVSRDELRERFSEADIETRTWFKPMHQQPHLSMFSGSESFPIAEGLYRRGIYLPLYPDLTEAELDRILDVIDKAHANRSRAATKF